MSFKSNFMRKLWLLFVLLFSANAFSQAIISNSRSVQKVPRAKSMGSSPWRVGGGAGFSMGNNDYVGFSITPFVGYEVIQNMELGLATGYQYVSRKTSKQNLFNIGPYLNYYPIPELFTRLQYEYYTGNAKVKSTGETYSFDENALWVGAGYRNVGQVQLYVGIMYNLLYNSDSKIFSNGFRPIVGVSFHL